MIVCDEKLLGKRLKDGRFNLDVRESFYGGKKASVEKCIEALQCATVANLLGSIVNSAIEVGMIDRGSVLTIQGVPHAQFVRL